MCSRLKGTRLEKIKGVELEYRLVVVHWILQNKILFSYCGVAILRKDIELASCKTCIVFKGALILRMILNEHIISIRTDIV